MAVYKVCNVCQSALAEGSAIGIQHGRESVICTNEAVVNQEEIKRSESVQ